MPFTLNVAILMQAHFADDIVNGAESEAIATRYRRFAP